MMTLQLPELPMQVVHASGQTPLSRIPVCRQVMLPGTNSFYAETLPPLGTDTLVVGVVDLDGG